MVLAVVTTAGFWATASHASAAPLGGAAGDSPPTEADDGRASFKAGVELYEAGNYAAALLEFRHAYERSGKYAALWNVVICERLLRHPVQALAALDELERAFPELSRRERSEIAEERAWHRDLVGTLTVDAAPGNAHVLLDGQGIRAATPIPVARGSHLVVVNAPDHVEVRRTVVVRDAKPVVLALQLEQSARPAPRPVPSDRWKYFAVGGASLAAVGLVAGAFALGGRGAASECSRDGGVRSCPDEATRASAVRAKTFATVSTVAVGLGVTIGGVGLGVWLADRRPTQGALLSVQGSF